MVRGPAKKPTELKKLEGNPGKRPLPLNEPKPAAFLPACPAFIKGAGRREWNSLAPELYQLGLLTRLDRAALGAYCSSYGLWVEAEHEIARIRRAYRDMLKLRKKNPNIKLPSNGMVSITSNGNSIMEPLLSVRKQALEQMKSFLVEFGMTPASRTRIVVEKYGEKDPMDELLEAGRNN